MTELLEVGTCLAHHISGHLRWNGYAFVFVELFHLLPQVQLLQEFHNLGKDCPRPMSWLLPLLQGRDRALVGLQKSAGQLRLRYRMPFGQIRILHLQKQAALFQEAARHDVHCESSVQSFSEMFSRLFPLLPFVLLKSFPLALQSFHFSVQEAQASCRHHVGRFFHQHRDREIEPKRLRYRRFRAVVKRQAARHRRTQTNRAK